MVSETDNYLEARVRLDEAVNSWLEIRSQASAALTRLSNYKAEELHALALDLRNGNALWPDCEEIRTALGRLTSARTSAEQCYRDVPEPMKRFVQAPPAEDDLGSYIYGIEVKRKAGSGG